MKMYNKEGLEVNVEKNQMNIMIEAGYSLNKPQISKPSEEEVKKPIKKVLKNKIMIKKG